MQNNQEALVLILPSSELRPFIMTRDNFLQSIQGKEDRSLS